MNRFVMWLAVLAGAFCAALAVADAITGHWLWCVVQLVCVAANVANVFAMRELIRDELE